MKTLQSITKSSLNQCADRGGLTTNKLSHSPAPSLQSPPIQMLQHAVILLLALLPQGGAAGLPAPQTRALLQQQARQVLRPFPSCVCAAGQPTMGPVQEGCAGGGLLRQAAKPGGGGGRATHCFPLHPMRAQSVMATLVMAALLREQFRKCAATDSVPLIIRSGSCSGV